MPGSPTFDCRTCPRCLLSFLQMVWVPGPDGNPHQIPLCMNCTTRDADMRRSAEGQAEHFLAERDAALREVEEQKQKVAQLLERLQRSA